jgi:thymidine kinase
MSKLYFRFSPMNSGKSTNIIQVAFNYNERNQKVLIVKPSVDTKSSQVVSRIGAAVDVNWHIAPKTNLVELLKAETEPVDCILVDEAQFLSREQVNQLFTIAVQHDVPVIAYGLRTDFQGVAFPGAQRLLELAHSLEELKTICRCGSKAMMNGRKVDGVFIQEGSQVAIDDGSAVEYESLCGKCYLELVGPLV